MKVWKIIGSILLMITSFRCFSFVLISGAYEAKLPVTPENPVVTFFWDGSLQNITEKDQLGIPQWESLDDQGYMEQVILLAMNQWNQVPGAYVQLELTRNDQTSLNSKDGAHVIAVKKDKNLSSSAFALPIVDKDEITDCDITLGKNTVTAKSLAYTITHELGHCLGLGHEHTDYDAVMGYARSNRSLRLGADDMAGLIYLYPDPSFSGPPPLPLKCSSIGPVLLGNEFLSHLWVGLFLLLPLFFLGTCKIFSNSYIFFKENL